MIPIDKIISKRNMSVPKNHPVCIYLNVQDDCMSPRVHQACDHLQHKQKREFSPAERLFICNLKMGAFPSVHYNELGIQHGSNLVGPLPGLLGRDFWNFSVISIGSPPQSEFVPVSAMFLSKCADKNACL